MCWGPSSRRRVADTLLGRIDAGGRRVVDEVRIADQVLREIEKVVTLACGMAFHARMIAKYAIERWARMPCEIEPASEFRYRNPILDQRILVVAISQSGETPESLPPPPKLSSLRLPPAN